ncbi:DUF1513 domain-containing protein [Ramlibacter terrae]|uniref:DUF1513 domain-containing protein n=1 Tax=Ramlibacter terrae TaxID=2732511 RepID=A0ABX6P3Z2_9BURK|nr:DUF1513 domain-containing protein [Ramlibacter terrae]
MGACGATARFRIYRETPDGERHVGLIARRGSAWHVRHQLALPTRGHGLLARPGGELLAVARRPGDWLLRWQPATGATQWQWNEPDRAFNGHVVASADGRRLYTTETDLETGAGLVGVRDAASLEKTAEWRTGGMDPHELLLDADGTLLVANGGIPTLPESGRVKVGLDRMDASLVRMATTDGARQSQWRLPDPRLSLRHLAWSADAGERVLGIALQAEHDDAAARNAAPVLALLRGDRLELAPAPRPLAGYGGAIAAAGGRFAVSCPRAGGVAVWDAQGRWAQFAPLAEACALASSASPGIWAGGRDGLQSLAAGDSRQQPLPPGLRLDNHWVTVSSPA